ncbi:hypothetical protein DUNSADRAFT_8164 [Dunaliella salina]|uniref:Encoded protein n=1 Tax=Dunaliella salina TaxID=3046 RepID=A0ABQ7GK53_DUNSA|nr:hypothetical protein DUNSADRAFT_8164 [Dunaliella salina]|eukprot:KAF5834893.1 hypothetical protein DUNSADRAFT_8164 [Dunaliella salina]
MQMRQCGLPILPCFAKVWLRCSRGNHSSFNPTVFDGDRLLQGQTSFSLIMRSKNPFSLTRTQFFLVSLTFCC